MRDINEALLVGRLGEDAVSRSFQNSGGVVSFSLATGKSYKDKASGEWKEKTAWHKVVLFDDHARRLAKDARKGDKVMVRGEILTRKYRNTTSGQDQWVTEVVVHPFSGSFGFMDSAREKRAYEAARDDGDRGPATGPAPDAYQTDLDDDVPF